MRTGWYKEFEEGHSFTGHSHYGLFGAQHRPGRGSAYSSLCPVPLASMQFQSQRNNALLSSTVKLKGRVELKTAERNFLMIDPHVTSLKPPTNLVRFVRLVPEFSRCRLIDGCAKATPEQHRHFARAPCR